MESYLPIGLLFIFTLIVCLGIFLLANILGPKNSATTKLSAYECGIIPDSNARAPFKNGFYLVAVLFLIVDVEAAFFLPWALVYRESLKEGPALLFAMLIYLAFVVLGLVYIFRKKGLNING